MLQQNWWAKVWTIHDSAGAGNGLIPKDATFWFEPVCMDGALVCYFLRSDSGLHPCLRSIRLYPLGVEALREEDLPSWKEHDEGLREKFAKRAKQVKDEGRADPLAERLEGTFWADASENVRKLEMVRFYIFPGLENGKDWIVIDIMPPGDVAVQDGTGHGDA